jgi:hypothetical protein
MIDPFLAARVPEAVQQVIGRHGARRHERRLPQDPIGAHQGIGEFRPPRFDHQCLRLPFRGLRNAVPRFLCIISNSTYDIFPIRSLLFARRSKHFKWQLMSFSTAPSSQSEVLFRMLISGVGSLVDSRPSNLIRISIFSQTCLRVRRTVKILLTPIDYLTLHAMRDTASL